MPDRFGTCRWLDAGLVSASSCCDPGGSSSGVPCDSALEDLVTVGMSRIAAETAGEFLVDGDVRRIVGMHVVPSMRLRKVLMSLIHVGTWTPKVNPAPGGGTCETIPVVCSLLRNRFVRRRCHSGRQGGTPFG